VLFAWTTTPPVDIRSKAGFLEDRKDLVKINEVLRCNDIARQIMSHEDIPIADFADVFRHFTHHRANDGVHWNERAHRRMTNILLETVSRHFNRPVPRPVSDEFNRNLDFDDRPPFPHSFSQPAFHHNDSWGSVDEFNWYNDGYMNYSAHDDFLLGLDRSYGYGNQGYFERDDDIPPRYLPPPGRRMPPPPMRGPPPPPGYRYGTGDQGMMWEGRKRKVREDDIPDGFNNRRYQGSKKMSSPIVESKPKPDEAQKPASPELDEKPATFKSPASFEEKASPTSAQTQDNNDVLWKGIPENTSEPKVEDQKPELAQSVGDYKVEKSNNSTNSIGSEKNEILLSVPPEEQKTANNVPHEEALEKVVVQGGASVMDGKEISVDVFAVPCKDEVPGHDVKSVPDPGKVATVSSVMEEKLVDAIEIGDKSGLAEKPSVFSKLSHTTSLILQSLQKSWKPVSSEILAQSSYDTKNLETKQNENSVLEEKVLQPPKVGLEEKSGTAAREENSLLVPENGATESVRKNEPEISNSGDAAKAKGISYYDIEENLDDLVASLDKIDDDCIVDPMDLDEESLLLDDSDQPLSLAHGNHVAKIDVEMINARQSLKDEVLERQKEIVCSQVPKKDDEVKMFGEKQAEGNTVSSEKEFDTVSHTILVDSGSLDSKLDFNGSTTVESNDRSISVKTQNSELGSGKDTTQSDVENTKKETKGAIDIVSSGRGLVSGPTKPSVTTNAPTLNPISKSQGSKIISGNELEAISTGAVAPSATSAIAISSVIKAPAVLPITKEAVPYASANTGTTPVCSKVTIGVTFGVKSSQSARVGTNRTTAPFGQVTIVSSKSTTVQIGTKTGTVVCTSLKTTTSPIVRNTGVLIGTKTITSPIISKTTIATPGLSQSGDCNSPGPIIKSVPNTPVSVVVNITSTSSKSSLTVVDTRQKLLCVPNPPSLDMKSPFYKAKPTTKPSEISGSPSKPSVTTANKPPTSTAAGGNVQKEKSGTVDPDSKEKVVSKTEDGTSLKTKTKIKKKKKLGKKASKKAGKDGAENVDTGLKGVKDGGVKKKTKKDGKLKKKKLKDKNKKKSLCENKNVETSSENVTHNITPNSQHVDTSEPQSISIVAPKDRPNARLNQSGSFNRNKQFQNQTVPPESVNMISSFVPQGHQTFQQQQQQIGNAQPYFSNQQTFVPVIAQPQVVPSSQFPYTQQVFAGQNNTLGYGTGFNSLGTNAMFGVNPMVVPGFQQVDYYGQQVSNQINGMGSVKNPTSQPKEYQHLAWL